jgi:DNA-binding LytR/AlgR family response regulator
LSLKAVIFIRNGATARKFKRQICTLGNAADDIIVFPDPGQALRYLEKFPADAVFLDIDDAADWQNVCERVKYADRRIRLVLLSGNPLNAVKAFEAGASGFLLKPVEAERLAKMLGRCARAE